MAKKKAAPKAAEPAAPEPAAPVEKQTTKPFIPAGGIAADDLAVLDQPIDDRMAALLKDHQRMGARPK